MELPNVRPGRSYSSAVDYMQKAYKGRKSGLKKAKKSGSFTTTKFDNRAVAENNPLGGSTSHFTLVKPKKNMAHVEKAVSNQVVVKVGAARLTSLIGKQEFANVQEHFTVADLLALFTNSLGAGSNKTTKVLLKSVVSSTFITNQENVPIYFTIYDIFPKRDGAGVITSPQQAFQTGMLDASGGAAANYLVPGVDPYMIPKFTEFFNIAKSTTGSLLPGNVHVHKTYFEPNQIFSHEIDSYVSNYVHGLTHYTCIMFHGTPINDSTTKTQVSLSPANLDYVTKDKFTYQMYYYPLVNTTTTNSLPTAFGVAGEVINEFTGAAMLDANA